MMKSTEVNRCFLSLIYLAYPQNLWYRTRVVKRTRAVHPAFVITEERGEVMDMYDFISLMGCLFSFISLLISVYLLGRDK